MLKICRYLEMGNIFAQNCNIVILQKSIVHSYDMMPKVPEVPSVQVEKQRPYLKPIV